MRREQECGKVNSNVANYSATAAPRWIGRVNSEVCPGPVTAVNAGHALVPCVAWAK